MWYFCFNWRSIHWSTLYYSTTHTFSTFVGCPTKYHMFSYFCLIFFFLFLMFKLLNYEFSSHFYKSSTISSDSCNLNEQSSYLLMGNPKAFFSKEFWLFLLLLTVFGIPVGAPVAMGNEGASPAYSPSPMSGKWCTSLWF